MKNLILMAQMAIECLQAGRVDETLMHLGMLESKLAAQDRRLLNLSVSMRDRAIDNPQGIQADTLTMFADELQLAIKP